MSTLLLLAATWALLLGGGALVPARGEAGASFLAFAGAAVLVWTVRARSPSARWRRAHSIGRAGLAAALATAAGFVSLPVWSAALASLGLGLGLPGAEARAPLASRELAWLGALCVAPFFEEPLYRERLLLGLRARTGGATAVVVSSAAFALPHAQAWSLLGAFCGGVALGLAALAWRSLAVCVGLHLGLNLAIARCGLPPAHPVLSGEASFVASALLLSGVGCLLGFRRARSFRMPESESGG